METKAVYNSIITIIDLFLKAIQIKLAKKPVLQFLFTLTTKMRCFLYFIKSSTDSVLFALFFNLELFIIAFLKSFVNMKRLVTSKDF